jgi:hypothetical protein
MLRERERVTEQSLCQLWQRDGAVVRGKKEGPRYLVTGLYSGVSDLETPLEPRDVSLV